MEGAVEYVECVSACDVGRVVDGSWVGDCCGGGVAVGVCGAVEFSYGWHGIRMITISMIMWLGRLLDGHAWLDLDVPGRVARCG